jgi:hypothetical protein
MANLRLKLVAPTGKNPTVCTLRRRRNAEYRTRQHPRPRSALALINHLVDNGQNEISQQAMRKALAFSKYLETHARRLYGATNEPERAAAQAILTKIRKGELQDGFTAREVHQHDWSGLTDREQVQAGLNLLVERHHLAPSGATTSERGGRPTTAYLVNPRGYCYRVT